MAAKRGGKAPSRKRAVARAGARAAATRTRTRAPARRPVKPKAPAAAAPKDGAGKIVSLTDRRLRKVDGSPAPDRTRAKGPREMRGSEHRRDAVALRIRGATYEEIGRALGIAKQSAWELVDRAFQANETEVAENLERLRQIEVARLDLLLSSVMPAADRGNLGAVDRALKIAERRARLLGLDLAGSGSAIGVEVRQQDGETEVRVMYVDDWRTD